MLLDHSAPFTSAVASISTIATGVACDRLVTLVGPVTRPARPNPTETRGSRPGPAFASTSRTTDEGPPMRRILLPLALLLTACDVGAPNDPGGDRVVAICDQATGQCDGCRNCYNTCLCNGGVAGECALTCGYDTPPAPRPDDDFDPGPDPEPGTRLDGGMIGDPLLPPAPDTDAGPLPRTDPDPEDPEPETPDPEDPPPPPPDLPPPPPPPEAPDEDCYWELVDPDADVDDLVARYGGAWGDIQAIVARRWPAGGWFIGRIQNIDPFRQLDQFIDRRSWRGMVGELDTLVHEGQHLFNAYHAQDAGRFQDLWIRDDLIYTLDRDSDGFARQQIRGDMEAGTCDLYCGTYFSGEQGSRGFNALLDEASCYANELGVGLFGEYYPLQGASVRDGSVAFLYYIQLYLRRARQQDPGLYARLQADANYPGIVKTLWLRGHFFLQYADRFPALGVSDDVYKRAMHRPENMAEISRFIGEEVDASHCIVGPWRE